MPKTYLGDGVYAEPNMPFPGAITLTTETGMPQPDNIIVLEPEVAQALETFIKKTLYPA